MAYDTEKLKLQTNIPELIALEFDRGLPVSGTYGDQVLFTLTDGRKWYAPPFVAAKVEAAGIPPGVFFTICKREIVDGNRRRVEYQLGDAPVVRATAAVNETTAVRSQNRSLPIQTNTASLPASPPLAEPSPERRPAAPAAVDSASTVALLKMAGCGAIDAVLAIEQYACDRGLTDFSFGVENIQKFAACLFIELNKRAGRAA